MMWQAVLKYIEVLKETLSGSRSWRQRETGISQLLLATCMYDVVQHSGFPMGDVLAFQAQEVWWMWCQQMLTR